MLHYVWPGKDDKSDMAKYCLKNWHEKLGRDWEIKEWNCETFDFAQHLKKSKFLQVVFKRKLYAFIADYVRTVVLYEYGGIYLDTDVTLVKKFDNTMLNQQMFLPIQNESLVEPAIWGAVRGHPFLKVVSDFFTDEINLSGEFIFPNIMKLLLDRQYKLGAFPAKSEQKKISTPDDMITFYPEEYFIPYRWDEKFMPTCITEKTTAIHWFKGSWCDEKTKIFFKAWFCANKSRETLKLPTEGY